MGTRDDIVAAAARIMRTDGYARATTKEIARTAGYSEAALYKHFADKTEIFLAVLAEQLPGAARLTEPLADRAGTGTLRANLVDVAESALTFYLESIPISASVFSSRGFLGAHRERMAELDDEKGPHKPGERLAAYLREERRLGRLRDTADPDAAAALVLGACFQQAFLASFTGEAPSVSGRREFAERLVGTLLAGLVVD